MDRASERVRRLVRCATEVDATDGVWLVRWRPESGMTICSGKVCSSRVGLRSLDVGCDALRELGLECTA